MHKPSPAHFVAAKRILRYLKGTLDRGILFQPGPIAFTAFTDADWAGDPYDRRLLLVLLFFLATITSPGSLRNNTPSLAHPLKQNIAPLLVVLLSLHEFVRSFVIWVCFYLPLL